MHDNIFACTDINRGKTLLNFRSNWADSSLRNKKKSQREDTGEHGWECKCINNKTQKDTCALSKKEWYLP